MQLAGHVLLYCLTTCHLKLMWFFWQGSNTCHPLPQRREDFRNVVLQQKIRLVVHFDDAGLKWIDGSARET
jgi:hypothetical protein